MALGAWPIIIILIIIGAGSLIRGVCVCLFSDQCVDKAKLEESEQRAAEFSKKVKAFTIVCSGHWYAADVLAVKQFWTDE